MKKYDKNTVELLEAINRYCLTECYCDTQSEIRRCNRLKCPLHKFRTGKIPRPKKVVIPPYEGR